ncbi:Apolipoprotein D [Habropoda laboriosa]|uniref:Apolipoprotein D n=1 Tax=Habropoda laboriosa TaxID=597456 RepID=A0A0L7R393_9HYME|nr:PREDICTED: apolipoprotein D-like [Habropoda laboriosa]KOC65251.1 Apolipoprotein D [Habropoda laboriosa]
MKILFTIIFLTGCFVLARSHTYHLGDCPLVEPAKAFEMSRFLGLWYVIQKTSTASKCITYNYTRDEEPGVYILTQVSDHPILGLTPLKHRYHYTGELTVPEPSTPARMEIRFPLNLIGSASHVVVSTDYQNYAVIFTCQKLKFWNRQSLTILSRNRDLDKTYLIRIRDILSFYGVGPYGLSNIPQTGCPHGNNTLDINVDPNTFTAENIENVVRKAGQKLCDGVEWVVSAGSKVYHKIAGSEEKETRKPEANSR